jgi:predicted ATPase/DNA-binding CsgD family transcriptional regulator
MTKRLPLSARNTLVGRDAEFALLEQWLANQDCRLVTLLGPGGIGKTRLAQELVESWPYGLVWVSLDDVQGEKPALLTELGYALELPDCSEQEWHKRLDTSLRSRTLIVLDSFEHIREQAPEVSSLLSRHPQLSVLVTSRAPLLLNDERLLSLIPLDLEHSIELLLTRARSVRPDFEATQSNRALLENLCRRLDGIPLALELAAARLRHLGLAELERGLQESIELLSGGGPDRPDRQKTLAATLEWSSRLLQPSERELLARLSVFRGGFDQKAAIAISSNSALEDLLSLSDQSLVVTSHSSAGETRYALLDTVRTWVDSALEPGEDRDALALVHARHYLDLAEALALCRGGADHPIGLKRLADEKGNLARALQTFQERTMVSEALRLVGCLGWYWEACSLLTEGRRALETTLALAVAETVESAAAHHWLGVLLRHQGTYEEAYEHGSKALELQPDLARVSELQRSLGQLAFRQGQYKESEEHFQKALQAARDSESGFGEIDALNGLGRLAWVTGNVKEGVEFEHQSLTLAQEKSYPLGEAWAHNALGEIHRSLQEPRAAALHFRRASECFGSLHEFSLGALALQNLAYVELGLKRWDEAEKGFREALSLWRKAGARHGLALCLIGLAGVLSAEKRDKLGARFLGAADGLLHSIQVRLEASDQEDYASIQGALRSRLGEDFKEEHWAGRQSPLDELLEQLEVETEPLSVQGLTPREREVLQAAATGASNKEVAQMLVISPQTVMVHLRSIYRKLNVTSRTAASRWAVENGLVK